MPSRCSDFSTACPARPKNATPSCTSAGCGRCLSRKTSPSGCPDPSTGTRPAPAARPISSPRALISVMAFCRYFSEISSVGKGVTGLLRSSGLADSFLGLGDPLQPLEVHERLRPPHNLRRPQAEQELLGTVERAHPQR